MKRSLIDLILEGEHQQQDFKFRVDDARKIARTLSAFANTDGGRLLIGVKDNGRIAGVRSQEELHVIETAALLYTKPEVTYESQLWREQGKNVLEVWIPRSEAGPHLAKDDHDQWRPYVRKDDHNFVANRVLTRVWRMGKSRRGAEVQFTETENQLFSYLRENERITFSKFGRLSGLKPKAVEALLAKLISWEVLEMELTEKGVFYHLSASER